MRAIDIFFSTSDSKGKDLVVLFVIFRKLLCRIDTDVVLCDLYCMLLPALLW